VAAATREAFFATAAAAIAADFLVRHSNGNGSFSFFFFLTAIAISYFASSPASAGCSPPSTSPADDLFSSALGSLKLHLNVTVKKVQIKKKMFRNNNNAKSRSIQWIDANKLPHKYKFQ
jgi:hypothetical protein